MRSLEASIDPDDVLDRPLAACRCSIVALGYARPMQSCWHFRLTRF